MSSEESLFESDDDQLSIFEEQLPIFSGYRFWVHTSVPHRNELVSNIEKHSGIITEDPGLDVFNIVGNSSHKLPRRFRSLACFSAEFIPSCIERGEVGFDGNTSYVIKRGRYCNILISEDGSSVEWNQEEGRVEEGMGENEVESKEEIDGLVSSIDNRVGDGSNSNVNEEPVLQSTMRPSKMRSSQMQSSSMKSSSSRPSTKSSPSQPSTSQPSISIKSSPSHLSTSQALQPSTSRPSPSTKPSSSQPSTSQPLHSFHSYPSPASSSQNKVYRDPRIALLAEAEAEEDAEDTNLESSSNALSNINGGNDSNSRVKNTANSTTHSTTNLTTNSISITAYNPQFKSSQSQNILPRYQRESFIPLNTQQIQQQIQQIRQSSQNSSQNSPQNHPWNSPQKSLPRFEELEPTRGRRGKLPKSNQINHLYSPPQPVNGSTLSLTSNRSSSTSPTRSISDIASIPVTATRFISAPNIGNTSVISPNKSVASKLALESNQLIYNQVPASPSSFIYTPLPPPPPPPPLPLSKTSSTNGTTSDSIEQPNINGNYQPQISQKSNSVLGKSLSNGNNIREYIDKSIGTPAAGSATVVLSEGTIPVASVGASPATSYSPVTTTVTTNTPPTTTTTTTTPPRSSQPTQPQSPQSSSKLSYHGRGPDFKESEDALILKIYCSMEDGSKPRYPQTTVCGFLAPILNRTKESIRQRYSRIVEDALRFDVAARALHTIDQDQWNQFWALRMGKEHKLLFTPEQDELLLDFISLCKRRYSIQPYQVLEELHPSMKASIARARFVNCNDINLAKRKISKSRVFPNKNDDFIRKFINENKAVFRNNAMDLLFANNSGVEDSFMEMFNEIVPNKEVNSNNKFTFSKPTSANVSQSEVEEIDNGVSETIVSPKYVNDIIKDINDIMKDRSALKNNIQNGVSAGASTIIPNSIPNPSIKDKIESTPTIDKITFPSTMDKITSTNPIISTLSGDSDDPFVEIQPTTHNQTKPSNNLKIIKPSNDNENNEINKIIHEESIATVQQSSGETLEESIPDSQLQSNKKVVESQSQNQPPSTQLPSNQIQPIYPPEINREVSPELISDHEIHSKDKHMVEISDSDSDVDIIETSQPHFDSSKLSHNPIIESRKKRRYSDDSHNPATKKSKSSDPIESTNKNNNNIDNTSDSSDIQEIPKTIRQIKSIIHDVEISSSDDDVYEDAQTHISEEDSENSEDGEKSKLSISRDKLLIIDNLIECNNFRMLVQVYHELFPIVDIKAIQLVCYATSLERDLTLSLLSRISDGSIDEKKLPEESGIWAYDEDQALEKFINEALFPTLVRVFNRKYPKLYNHLEDLSYQCDSQEDYRNSVPELLNNDNKSQLSQYLTEDNVLQIIDTFRDAWSSGSTSPPLSQDEWKKIYQCEMLHTSDRVNKRLLLKLGSTELRQIHFLQTFFQQQKEGVISEFIHLIISRLLTKNKSIKLYIKELIERNLELVDIERKLRERNLFNRRIVTEEINRFINRQLYAETQPDGTTISQILRLFNVKGQDYVMVEFFKRFTKESRYQTVLKVYLDNYQ